MTWKCNLKHCVTGWPYMLPSAPLKLNPLQATAARICKNAPSQQGGIFQFKFRSILLSFFSFFNFFLPNVLNCYQMSLAYRLLIAGSCYKH